MAPVLGSTRKDSRRVRLKWPLLSQGVWKGSAPRHWCTLCLSVYLDPQQRQNFMLKSLFRENMEMPPAMYVKHLLRLMPKCSFVKETYLSCSNACEIPSATTSLCHGFLFQLNPVTQNHELLTKNTKEKRCRHQKERRCRNSH